MFQVQNNLCTTLFEENGKNARFALFKTSAKLQLFVLFDLEKKIVVKPNIRIIWFLLFFYLDSILQLFKDGCQPRRPAAHIPFSLAQLAQTPANPSWG